MQLNLQRNGGQGLPGAEGAPDVNSAEEKTGLEEGSPLQKKRAWRQPSQAAAPACCCCCLPLLAACTLLPRWRFIYLFLFVGRGGFQHTPLRQEKWKNPSFRGVSPQPPLGHSSCGAPPYTPSHQPSSARLGQHRASPVLHPSNAHRVPSFPADPSSPSSAFSPKPDSPTHRGWEHRPFLQAAPGAEPQDEVGAPPKLPRVGFSLWTLRLLASGRSSER